MPLFGPKTERQTQIIFYTRPDLSVRHIWALYKYIVS